MQTIFEAENTVALAVGVGSAQIFCCKFRTVIYDLEGCSAISLIGCWDLDEATGMREVVFGFFGREAISDQDLIFFRIAAGVVDDNGVAAEGMTAEGIAGGVSGAVIGAFGAEDACFLFCYAGQLFSLLRLSRRPCGDGRCAGGVQSFQRLDLRCRLCGSIPARAKATAEPPRGSSQSEALEAWIHDSAHKKKKKTMSSWSVTQTAIAWYMRNSVAGAYVACFLRWSAAYTEGRCD